MGNLGCRKQHSTSIGTRSYTGTTADTSGCVKGQCSPVFFNWNCITVNGLPCIDRDKTSGLNNAVKCTPINHEVANDRKSFCAERLNPEVIAILEKPHMKLTGRCALQRTVRTTVDDHTTRSADTFAAIVFKCYRLLAFLDELLVEYIDHLEEGHMFIDHDVM